MNAENAAIPVSNLSKRDLLGKAGLFSALLTLGAAPATQGVAAQSSPVPLDFPGVGPIPWIKRVFHLYTHADGFTRVEQLTVTDPGEVQVSQLLRRTAARVTIAGSAAGAGFDFHVANQPTILIPLFGSMMIGLHDGTQHELRHGDLAFAEDCSGKGHISRAGPQGSFMISVQLPKPLCPASGSSDTTKIWND